MNASPVQPPDASFMDWITAHWETAISAIFGAGLGWGATRTTVNDHARRLNKLEEDGPAHIAGLEGKIDRNHAQLVGLIVDLARGDRPQRN